MTTLSASPTTSGQELLTDAMLARFGERAPIYDRDNRFFDEDFEELRGSGYLTCAVPTDLGGAGLSLADVCRLQRRLAYRAPATAGPASTRRVVGSTPRAKGDGGAYPFYGNRFFGSLAPLWTRLGVHAMD